LDANALTCDTKKGIWESMELCNRSLVLFADLFWLCFMWVDEGNP